MHYFISHQLHWVYRSTLYCYSYRLQSCICVSAFSIILLLPCSSMVNDQDPKAPPQSSHYLGGGSLPRLPAGYFWLSDNSQSSSETDVFKTSSSTAVPDPLIPAKHTITNHHHANANVRMTHHPNYTCSVVALWDPLKNKVKRGQQSTQRNIQDYSLLTKKCHYMLSGAEKWLF